MSRRICLGLTVLCVACGACNRAPAPAASSPASADYFDLRSHPDAIVLQPIDPATLTESERKFGIAPKRDPRVEYQPDIILMESGDRAIRSIANDGLHWTFDANAPQVSDFKLGKIVFATGRAVGRIIFLQREGDAVSVVLGPIQLTDVLRNGHFALQGDVDFNKVLVYTAPDYPQPAKTPDAPTAAIFSGASLLQAVAMPIGIPVPGVPLTQFPTGISPPPAPNPPDMSHAPAVNVGANVRVEPVASNSGIGSNYYYITEPLSVVATSLMGLNGSGMAFDLDIGNGKPITAGLKLNGAANVRLTISATSRQSFNVNWHQTFDLPVDFSIPLSGPVPFALTFHQLFEVSTGFSAKNALMHAEGNYGFGGGLKAGFWNGKWGVETPTQITAVTDIGKSIDGISVGINSLLLSTSLRALAGIGAYGFATGIYASLRTGATTLRAPDIAIPCKQGTFEMHIDTGIGYSLPKFVKDAINLFMSIFTDYRVSGAGSLIPGPTVDVFTVNTQFPKGCSTPNKST